VSEGRFEFKYMIPEQRVSEVLDLVRPYAALDPNGEILPSGRRGYVVSSLYLDDAALSGYSERLRMARIRNRVRVRTYGRAGEGRPVFLEAKRKLDNQVIKHRVRVCTAEQWASLGERPWQRAIQQLEGSERLIGKRWVQHVDTMHMMPVCTVRYEREIYVEGRARLTLDRDVRGTASPPAEDLYVPSTLQLLPRDWVVLELKFNGSMPVWMRDLVRAMSLRSEPVSKFGLGVVQGLRATHPGELRQLIPYSVRAEGVA